MTTTRIPATAWYNLGQYWYRREDFTAEALINTVVINRFPWLTYWLAGCPNTNKVAMPV
jgi:hypothetical protein